MNNIKTNTNDSKFVKWVENKPNQLVTIFLTVAFCFFLIPWLITKTSGFYFYNKDTADIANTIGGITSPLLAFIGIFLTFAAFYVQYKANLKQNENFSLQLFESKFFDLLKMHRENILEMEIGSKTQRRVFVILRYEYQDIYEVVKKHMANIDDDDNRKKADITFLFLFFGVGITTSPLVQEITAKYNSSNEIRLIDNELTTLQKRKVSQTKFLKKINFGEDSYFPFNGHQARLAHYFRHLYQIVKFIELDQNLDFSQKKYYAKVLRAQLGTHELAILFYNSLSSIGMPWKKEEWKKEALGNEELKNEKIKEGEKVNLITKYELLKNLPIRYFTFELPVTTFYPHISYEWNEMIEESKVLP